MEPTPEHQKTPQKRRAVEGAENAERSAKERERKANRKFTRDSRTQIDDNEMRRHLRNSDDIITGRTHEQGSKGKFASLSKGCDALEKELAKPLSDRHVCTALQSLLTVEHADAEAPEKMRERRSSSMGGRQKVSFAEAGGDPNDVSAISEGRQSGMMEEVKELQEPPEHARGSKDSELPPLPAMEEDDDKEAEEEGPLTQALHGDDPESEEMERKGECGKRARAVEEHVRQKVAEGRKVSLGEMASGRSRREASRLFFELMVLGGKGSVSLSQEAPFGDIWIGSGDTA